MLVTLDKFGGKVPRVKDPCLVPVGKSVVAQNCRFDRGGLIPLQTNLFVSTPTKAGTKQSLFLYRNGANEYFFTWITDVNAVRAPLASDAYNRIYYTESGALKVTDNTLFDVGGTDYPMQTRTLSVPAPTTALTSVNTTKLVINGNGVLDSTNITDVSPFGRSVTVGGNAKIDTAQKVFGSASVTFDGTNSNITAGISSDFSFGTSAFAIHGRFRFTALPTSGNYFALFSMYQGAGDYILGKIHNTAGSYTIVFSVVTTAGGTHTISIPITAATNTWYHIAFIRGWGGVTNTDAGWKITLDGADVGTTTAASAPTISATVSSTFVIGSHNGGSWLNGHVDELVVINGYTPWTAAFTPPTTPENSDETLMETRGYVYTFVTSYGEEGPPSPVSTLLDCYDGNCINLSAMETVPAGHTDITLKRIYRLNQAASGTTDYQFVAEIAIATTTYSDALLDSSLGEVLPSAEWDEPPTGLAGLISLPNGILAGFVNNLLCMCVPNFPHAWPTAYQKPVDADIVGLGAFGTTIAVLTEGVPYLAVGNDPTNVVLERMDLGFSCSSKRGIVDAGDVIIYPSPAGMAAIGSGVRDIITNDYMTPEDWAEYNPTTIQGYYWKGHYVGFYLDDDTVGRKGFMIDLKTKDFTDLDFYATGGFHDENTGKLYLIVSGDVVEFNGGATNRTYSYQSHRYRFAKNSFGVMKVIASTYPVTVDAYYPEAGVTVSITALNRNPVRMTGGRLIDALDIKASGSGELTAVMLATTMGELPV